MQIQVSERSKVHKISGRSNTGMNSSNLASAIVVYSRFYVLSCVDLIVYPRSLFVCYVPINT
jgi:hypothetical protein